MKLNVPAWVWMGLSFVGGCAAADNELVPSATAHEGVTNQGELFDTSGRRWRNNGKVTYARTSYESLQEQLQVSAGAEPGRVSFEHLDELTDEEAMSIVRPRMEFGGTEFVMEDDDVRQFVHVLRELKSERDPTALGMDLGASGQGPTEDDAGSSLGSVAQELIINGDQRANNNHRADEYPYSAIGQGGTASDRWCTCFKMINQHTCITAGHCHWWKGQWQERRPITFKAGSSSPLTRVPANCYARTTWYSGGEDHDLDIAVIALRGRGNASCDPATYSVGWLGWHEPPGINNDFKGWTAGYPASPPSGWSYPTQTHQSSSNNSYRGIYMPALTHTLDMTGGQSGAPIVTTWENGSYRVRAVHWGSLTPNSDYNAAVPMWAPIVELLESGAGY